LKLLPSEGDSSFPSSHRKTMKDRTQKQNSWSPCPPDQHCTKSYVQTSLSLAWRRKNRYSTWMTQIQTKVVLFAFVPWGWYRMTNDSRLANTCATRPIFFWAQLFKSWWGVIFLVIHLCPSMNSNTRNLRSSVLALNVRLNSKLTPAS
jgi:hypothetical protein